jgi:hypothetical protein
MDITFDLGGLHVEIDGVLGKELTIDGLTSRHVATILEQLKFHYDALESDTVAAALDRARLETIKAASLFNQAAE